MMTRRVFLGMAGVAGAGLWLGVPDLRRPPCPARRK